jgi:hypothetical protein
LNFAEQMHFSSETRIVNPKAGRELKTVGIR